MRAQSYIFLTLILLVTAACQKGIPSAQPSLDAPSFADVLEVNWKMTDSSDPTVGAIDSDNSYVYLFHSTGNGSVTKVNHGVVASPSSITYNHPANTSSLVVNFSSAPMAYQFNVDADKLTLTSTITGFAYHFIAE